MVPAVLAAHPVFCLAPYPFTSIALNGIDPGSFSGPGSLVLGAGVASWLLLLLFSLQGVSMVRPVVSPGSEASPRPRPALRLVKTQDLDRDQWLQVLGLDQPESWAGFGGGSPHR